MRAARLFLVAMAFLGAQAMRLLLVGLAALALMGESRAEGTNLHSVGVHIATAHLRGTGWNSVNPGVYLRWDSGLTVGTLVNSEYRQSAYLGWTFDHVVAPRLRASLTAGVITGYRRGASPLLSPSLALAIDHHTWVRFAYLPQAHQTGSAGVHLSIERRF